MDGAIVDRQVKALRSLERAFHKCSDLGLTFVGMDTALLAFDSKTLDFVGWSEDPHKAMRDLGQGYSVNTHGAYRDSGGW